MKSKINISPGGPQIINRTRINFKYDSSSTYKDLFIKAYSDLEVISSRSKTKPGLDFSDSPAGYGEVLQAGVSFV